MARFFSTKGEVNSANFYPFWVGQALSAVGTRLSMVALPVIATNMLQASSQDLGILNACQTIAFLVIGLPAGAWIDRWLKRRTMIIADIVRMITSLIIPVAFMTGHLAMWQLYVVGLIIGVATLRRGLDHRCGNFTSWA